MNEVQSVGIYGEIQSQMDHLLNIIRRKIKFKFIWNLDKKRPKRPMGILQIRITKIPPPRP